MSFERRDELIVEYSLHRCSLSAHEWAACEQDLELLERVVARFPASLLHVDLSQHARTGAWEVKLDLLLARSLNFFARRIAARPHPAFKRCVRRLISSVRAFRDSRNGHERRGRERRGQVEIPTRHVRAPVEPDLHQLAEAAADGDYPAFRNAIALYRETLRMRLGRRIELHPDAAAQLGVRISLEDCVEEVFLQAFENFQRRPTAPAGLGAWLETLLDRSIRTLARDPDEERRVLGFARTARSVA